ncbi:MAG: hypothetical protein VYD71_03595 [Bacteroidota bacterium]|nr:hypothetical protein [Bacteroidota bacterium]
MRNYTRILIMMIISLLFIISSCKKEEEIIEGCTDSTAMNYNSNATSNDGSCKYAYNIAQGVWNITPNCDDLPIPGVSLNDVLPESIELQGAGNNTLFIDIDGTQVTGNIDNYGNIIANEQTVQIDVGLGIPTDVQVSGNGKILSENAGHMDLTYSFDILILGSQSTSCNIILVR